MKFTIPNNGPYFEELQLKHNASFYTDILSKCRLASICGFIILVICLVPMDTVLRFLVALAGLTIVGVSFFYSKFIVSARDNWYKEIRAYIDYLEKHNVTDFDVELTDEYIFVDMRVFSTTMKWVHIANCHVDEDMLVLHDLLGIPLLYIGRKEISEEDFNSIRFFIETKLSEMVNQ